MEFLYEARRWATDRGLDPISNFLPLLGGNSDNDFSSHQDQTNNLIQTSPPHRNEKRSEHSSPESRRMPSYGRASTLSISSPVPPMPPQSPTVVRSSRILSRTPPPPPLSASRLDTRSLQSDADFEMRRKIEFNANAMRSNMNNNNNRESDGYTLDVDTEGVSLNRIGVDILASHVTTTSEPSSRYSSGPSHAELLNTARQRAIDAEQRARDAEQRCTELEAVVEKYSKQGAGLEALAKDLNQTVNQQIADVTEEAREAKMRAFRAESELNLVKEQLIKTLSELEEMKKALKSAHADSDAAKADAESMRRRAEAQIDEIKRAVTDHAEQISTEAQAAVHQAKRAMDEAIREAERLRERESAAKADASTAQSRIATLLEDFEIMKMEAQASKSSTQTSDSLLAAAREEIERLRIRLAKVETQNASTAGSLSNTIGSQKQQDTSATKETLLKDTNNLVSSDTRTTIDAHHSDIGNTSKQVSTAISSTTSSSSSSLSALKVATMPLSLSTLRQVVVHVTDPDAPSLLPRPQHTHTNVKSQRDTGPKVSVQSRTELLVLDGDEASSFAAHLVVGGHTAKAGDYLSTLNNMLVSISESVVNGGRSSAILLGSAPSLGDGPFQALSSAASSSLFRVIERSAEREGGVVNRSVGVGMVEVGPATTITRNTNRSANSEGGLEDEVRDILDAYSSKGSSSQGDYDVVGSIDDARLVAPVISLTQDNYEDEEGDNSASLSLISKAATVVVTGSEGVDVVVELALRNRANIRAFGTPESASTIEAALLLTRTHAVLTLSVTHSTTGEGSFVSRLHIVQLACPGHIGAVEQINASPPLLPHLLFEGVKAESRLASKTLSSIATAWNVLESSSKRNGGNNNQDDDLAGRLELDAFANKSVLTSLIADALQPASPLLFLVELPPILNRFADADAAASFLSTASDITRGFSRVGSLAVSALENQLHQNRLMTRYLAAPNPPPPNVPITQTAPRRSSTIGISSSNMSASVVSTNSVIPQRDFVRSGTGTGGGGLHAVWDPIIRKPLRSRRKSQSALEDTSLRTQATPYMTPKASSKSSSFGSTTSSNLHQRSTSGGPGATPFRDPIDQRDPSNTKSLPKKPAVPRLSASSSTFRPVTQPNIQSTSTRFDDIDAAIEQELLDASVMRNALLREKQLIQTHSSQSRSGSGSGSGSGSERQREDEGVVGNKGNTQSTELYNDEPNPVPGMRAILQVAAETGGLRPSSFDTLRAMLSSSDLFGYGKVSPRAFAQGLSRWLPHLGLERAIGIVASMGIVDEGGDDTTVGEDGVDYDDFVNAVEALWKGQR